MTCVFVGVDVDVDGRWTPHPPAPGDERRNYDKPKPSHTRTSELLPAAPSPHTSFLLTAYLLPLWLCCDIAGYHMHE